MLIFLQSEISITIPAEICLISFSDSPPVKSPEGFLGIVSGSPAGFPSNILAGIPAGLFSRFSTETPLEMYRDSIGIFFKIFPSRITPWIYLAIYLGIIQQIHSKILAGISLKTLATNILDKLKLENLSITRHSKLLNDKLRKFVKKNMF